MIAVLLVERNCNRAVTRVSLHHRHPIIQTLFQDSPAPHTHTVSHINTHRMCCRKALMCCPQVVSCMQVVQCVSHALTHTTTPARMLARARMQQHMTNVNTHTHINTLISVPAHSSIHLCSHTHTDPLYQKPAAPERELLHRRIGKNLQLETFTIQWRLTGDWRSCSKRRTKHSMHSSIPMLSDCLPRSQPSTPRAMPHPSRWATMRCAEQFV